MNKKLGYYSVNSIEFESKLDACFYAQTQNAEVKWHFNNLAMDMFPWNIEPKETLDQLYDKRAKQLREEYDYIMISYSGGADSHNVLMSFLRQGLHVDELICNTMESASRKYTVIDPSNKDPRNAAAEHDLQTIPRLKEINKKYPKIKITVTDMTEYLFEHWLTAKDASWIQGKKEGLNPLNVTRFNYLHFNEVRKRFDKEKKIALVLGIEKPRCFIHSNGKFYVRFADRATNIITVANHIKEYDNSVVEYFYWCPEGLPIVAKQAFVIKRWLEANPNKQKWWFHKNMTADVYRHIHERELRPLIYSTWNDNWWQADKATLDWYSEFDHWWINGYQGTKEHAIWLEGLDYVKKNASNFIAYEHGFADGLQIHGKQFEVGRMNSEIIPEKLIINK